MADVDSLQPNDPRWPAFVKRFPWANAFHSPEMARALAASNGFEVFPLFALAGDDVVACALPVLVRCTLPLPGRFAKRLILYASPLYRDDPAGYQGMETLLARTRELAGAKAFFLEIRNSQPFPRESDAALTCQFAYLPRLNYLIDLSAGTTLLFERLASETRNRIRKAGRHGLQLRELGSAAELETAIAIVTELYRRKRVPMLDVSIFRQAFALLAPCGIFKAIAAFKGDEMVAVRFLLSYADTVIDWYAAARPESQKDYPNEALVWQALEWACGAGYHRFDFGGGGLRGQKYGPGQFKEKFRGATVEYGRYRWSSFEKLLTWAERLYAWRTRAE